MGAPPPIQPQGVWRDLAERISPAYERPTLRRGLVASRLAMATGEAYYIIKNPSAGTYVRLAPDEYFLLGLMDGTRQVRDLVLAYFREYKSFALGRIVNVVAQLRHHRFLIEEPRDAWGGLTGRLSRRTWAYRVDRLLAAFLYREFALRGIDGAVTALYRGVGWIFFTGPAVAALLVLWVGGGVLFLRELLLSGRDPFRFGGSAALGVPMLLLLSVVVLTIHEVGHALATKSYGRDVPRGGFMLYYGMPAFFVDTTDIWLEPRRARMVVSAAGMAAVWAVGGIGMLYVTIESGSLVAALAFQFAFVAFVDNSLNLLPLLELDGYFLLMDWLELPLLRSRALAFVRHDLLRKLTAREPFTREERVFAVFGVLAILGSIYILVAAGYMWFSGIQQFLVDVWMWDTPWARVAVALVVLVVGAALAFGTGVKIHQSLGTARGALAWLRHRREAARAKARLEARDLLGRLRFLDGLDVAQREPVIRSLRLRSFSAGQYVVREDERGDEFYLIRAGRAEVLKRGPDGSSRQLTILRRGDYFGELALLYEQPRLASVRALEKLEVYAMGRADFESIIAPRLRAYGLTVQLLEERAELSRMALFRQTPPSELDSLLASLMPEEFAAGSEIVLQGQVGDRFYLIRRGRVEVVERTADGPEQVLAELGPGEYFGEMALLRAAPRVATVRALEPVALWSLDKAEFDELLLGRLQLRGLVSAEVERRDVRRRRLAGEPVAL